jgi:hypothetical protein
MDALNLNGEVVNAVVNKVVHRVVKAWQLKEEEEEAERQWRRLESDPRYDAAWWEAVQRLSDYHRKHVREQLQQPHSAYLGDAVLQCLSCQCIIIGLPRMRTHLTKRHNYNEISIMNRVNVMEEGREFLFCKDCGYEAERGFELANHQRLDCKLDWGGGGGGDCCDRDVDCPIQPSTRTLTADTVKQEEEEEEAVGDDGD